MKKVRQILGRETEKEKEKRRKEEEEQKDIRGKIFRNKKLLAVKVSFKSRRITRLFGI